MAVLSRLLAVAALVCGALLVPAGPAPAASTITLDRLTAYPQAGGELALHGRTAEASASLRLDYWASGTGWTATEAEFDADDGGWFTVLTPLDRAPFASGGYFMFRVAAAGQTAGGAASEALGVYVFPGQATPFTTAPAPAVTGEPTVGSVLKATKGTWQPAPGFVALRWNRDGVATDVTGSTYPLTSADKGHYITVSAVAYPTSGSGFTVRDSHPTRPVSDGTFTHTTPEIVGRAVVGETLHVELGAWSPQPATVGYQWRRDGVPLTGETSARHVISAEDAGGVLTVDVHATADGVAPVDVTSAPFTVPAATAPGTRIGDLMHPAATTPWPPSAVAVRTGNAAPTWSDRVQTHWDAPGAFTHSLKPAPFLTLVSTMFSEPWARAADGAEYPGTNASLKNADVSFEFTGRRFAISYRGTRTMDAMVWLDDRPVAASPLVTQSPGDTTYALNWIVVELPERRTVRVRFAGPLNFVGVDTPAGDRASVVAADPRLTVGVVSDSYFDLCAEALCSSRAAAPTLSTQTGFRVWNLAEVGTGYLSPSSGPAYGEYKPGTFGSARRLDAVADAPIDLLLVNGSINDATYMTDSGAGHRAAVDKYLTDLARVRPDLPVVLVGIEPLGKFQSDYWSSLSSAMNTNLAAMVGRHQNVIGFIDPYTDRWLTGTGSIADPQGDGNQDQYVGTDGVHPSVAGVSYYVGRIVEELAELRMT